MHVVLTADHPRAQCVDLRATFAGEFRFAWDPSHDAERPEFRRVEAAWLTRIPCRFGFICPHGGRGLAAYSATRRAALAALPGFTVAHGGAGCPEVVVTFDVADLAAVAELLRARRPPRLSPDERSRRRERMVALRAGRKATLFSAQGTASSPVCQATGETDPQTTLKLIPLIRAFNGSASRPGPASAPRVRWRYVAAVTTSVTCGPAAFDRASPLSSFVSVDSSRPGS